MYRVELEDFEGPLDLLLLLINRREVDIFDIPIAQITNEYLAYVQLMESVNLDGVADYIYFAALLISIKARMLLPQPEIDTEEELDPRQQLVDRLLEYIQYKNAAETLNQQLEERSRLFTRGEASTPAEVAAPEKEVLVKTTIFELMNALRLVLEEAPDEETITIEPQQYSIEDQSEYIRRILFTEKHVSFQNLIRGQTRSFIVATLLAILEMAYGHEICILNAYDGNAFVIEKGGIKNV